MTEVKKCKLCGKEMWFALSWETECYSCRKKAYKNELISNIESGEITETFSEDSVFCPYCGCEHEPDGESDEFYVDGSYLFECVNCDEEFELETNISISYSTSRKEDK